MIAFIGYIKRESNKYVTDTALNFGYDCRIVRGRTNIEPIPITKYNGKASSPAVWADPRENSTRWRRCGQRQLGRLCSDRIILHFGYRILDRSVGQLHRDLGKRICRILGGD